MEIRKPNNTELEEIMLFSPQAMYEGTMGKNKTTKEMSKQLIEQLLSRGCYYLIASENDKLKGWILLGASKDQFSDTQIGFIYELYVIEEYRGKGISKHLVTSAINEMKNEGYLEIRLSVFAGNHAIHIYEKMGFTVRNITMSLS
jgi:ribosomal protein S18 acetylase RimI-like enzyme